VDVAYPYLTAVLTAFGSLVPVFRMRIVYLPLIMTLGTGAILGGEIQLLRYVIGLLLLMVIAVDFIPTLLLERFRRRMTPLGILVLTYTIGLVFYGFYGLLLAPIVLVLIIVFISTALPHIIDRYNSPTEDVEKSAVDHPDQTRLNKFHDYD
jgi:predicted PurR-regulated permease PerM